MFRVDATGKNPRGVDAQMNVRTIYNSTSVKHMTDEDLLAITACGIDPRVYTKGYIDLGAKNSTAVGRLAKLCTTIYTEGLPLPPSPFVEFICERTAGVSKQDFSMTIDGKKGGGKSRVSNGFGCRYGITMADRINAVDDTGMKPTDFFSLDNCALLEDSKAISRIMSNARKQQFIVIDDASVALGSRDFAQQKNKNFNKLLTTCRTRRWCIILNVPMASHLDLQIRELVDAKASIYKSYHAAGFNLLKIFSSDIQFRLNKKQTYEKRFSFNGKKFDMWGAYSSDVFAGAYGGCYDGLDEKYDAQRDAATTRILEETSADEEEMADPRGKRDKKWDALRDEFGPKISAFLEMPEFLNKDGKPIIRRIEQETGLNPQQVYRLLSEIRGGRTI
jgi:hypothetical protein